jgi:ABC-type uncharacterized transport system substrate-binding protein
MPPWKVHKLALRPSLRLVVLALVAACFLVFNAAFALSATAPDTVLVLLSEPGSPYRDFFEALHRSLEQASPGSKRLNVSELLAKPTESTGPASYSRPDDAALGGAKLIVAVGVQAMRAAARWEGIPPVLNVLVPRASYEKLLADPDHKKRQGQMSAIYLDHSLARQLNLIRLVLPGKRRISALLGPDSALLLPVLRAAAQRSGLQLVAEEVASEAEIIPALSRLMNSSEAFLALPDSVVFTRDTVRPVLMTAFRHQQPLFGFSQAYVTSGALAAVFSTPAQIARQTAELINALPAGRPTLPAALYPEYFSVAVNRSVARALDFDIAADALLREALMALPENK